MSTVLLLTGSVQPSVEVLPALALLPHQVKIMPAEGSALLEAPDGDVVLVDYAEKGLASVLSTGLAPLPEPPGRLLQRRCCRASYLRGAFVAAGSVSAPRAPGHLEIRVSEPEGARLVQRVARTDGIPLQVTVRRGQAVVYAKGKPTIRELLAHIGAHDAVLSLDEAEVISRTRERANRATNCDEANLARLGAAARAQAAAIAALDLDGLDVHLRQVADLRLRHPDLSLAELGRRARPPLAKSTVAGRMRVLVSAAEARRPARGGGRRSGGSS